MSHDSIPGTQRRTAKRPPQPGAFDVTSWCNAHNVSRSKLYELWRAGRGPKRRWLDGRWLISHDHSREWYEALPSHEEKIAA